jgi:hypothetical protein
MGDGLLPIDLGTDVNGTNLTALAVSANRQFTCAILVCCGGQRSEREGILTCFNLRESCFLGGCARGCDLHSGPRLLKVRGVA